MFTITSVKFAPSTYSSFKQLEFDSQLTHNPLPLMKAFHFKGCDQVNFETEQVLLVMLFKTLLV